MKKALIYCAILVTVLGTAFSNGSAAGVTVVEKPDIKININGAVGTYADVPVIVNNRTLLPLRAILVNLGVPNDDQHIQWNAAERSVTVNKDSTRIYLKIDSSSASVDGNNFTMDVAPIIYKDRTYIPARFMAQSFGKKVFWDGNASTAFIRDEGSFNEVKDILQKVDTAMNAVDRYKTNETENTGLVVGNITVQSARAATSQTDVKNQVGYAVMNSTMTVNGQSTNSTVQLATKDKAGYVKTSDGSGWSKVDITEDEFLKSFIYDDLKDTDTLAAGLVVDKSASGDIIKLSGKVNFSSYLGDVFSLEDISQYLLKDAYTEITIDKNTNLIKTVYGKASGTTTIKTANDAKIDVEATSNYTDYNGSFQVVLPADLV